MNLLRKYYDKDSIGGGIPDDVRRKIDEKAMKESSSLSDYLWLQNLYSYGYSLASEERQKTIDMMNKMINQQVEIVKERNEEISRLKEENERLRGEVDKLKTDNDNLGRHLPYWI